MTAPRLQPLTRARLASLGASGRAWEEGLPDLLAGLAERWDLRLGRSLPGGSASYVVRAVTRATGEPRVLKVAVPGVEAPLADEARTLAAAEGRGYAVLHAFAEDASALLLEALGPSAEQVPGETATRLAELADTLLDAWRVDLDLPVPAPGEDRASGLDRSVRDLARRLGDDACPPGVLDRALAHAAELAAAYRPEDCVVVHGDPHASNALRVPAPRPGTPPRPATPAGWVYVDPDGFRADPAYDLGILVRDHSAQVEAADDPHALVEGWCRVLADRTGLPEERIWAWGYLERVSTGLYVTGFGAEAVGRPFLSAAARLL